MIDSTQNLSLNRLLANLFFFLRKLLHSLLQLLRTLPEHFETVSIFLNYLKASHTGLGSVGQKGDESI